MFSVFFSSSSVARGSKTLVEKALFVSGRDAPSTQALSRLLQDSDSVVRPEGVSLVRDPVLGDKMLSDTEGKCWRQGEGGCNN